MVYLDFTSALYYLDLYGLTDLVLPFLLLFSVTFAILQQIGLFAEKKYNAIISLVMALMVVIPHVTGNYPGGYDVVEIINGFLPNAILVIVTLFIFLVLVSVVSGKNTIASSNIVAIVAGVAAIALVFVFVSSLSTDLPAWLSGLLDPTTQSLLIMLLIAGLVIWFITKSDKEPEAGEKKGINKLGQIFKDLFSEDGPGNS